MEKLNYYHSLFDEKPEFINPYISSLAMQRLKGIGYFCGMDWASKDIYDFKEYVSRFDHSLTVSCIVWKLTHDKVKTLAALFHDISSPCFSHVIDYMNKDYINQESTEKYTLDIVKNDKVIISNLDKDSIKLKDVINFKSCGIVDNERPKLCADRLDGIILNGLFWTKTLDINDVYKIINDITLENDEIGFNTYEVADKVMSVNKDINSFTHSKEDTFMMELLSHITSAAIKKSYITYKDLYYLTESELFKILDYYNDEYINCLLDMFKTIKREHIKHVFDLDIKDRKLNVLVKGKRING